MDKKEKVVETIMDVMESLSNYSEEEQNQIITTLTVIQERGWSHDVNDPYQFQIILGEKLMSQTKRIKSFENNLESLEEENLQKDKHIKDLKADLKHHKDVTEDMEQEINKRDDVINALQYGIDGKIKVIHDLVQIRKENEEENIHMEKKLKIQENVIKELSEKVKCETNDEIIEMTGERDKLLMEVKHLEQENEEKLKTLETIEIENMVLKDKLDKNDKAEEMDELESHFGRIFECKECVKTFGSRGNLKTHKRNAHGKENAMHVMQLRLHEMDKRLSDQKFNLTLKIYKLKEVEFIKKETCKCIGWCGISHQKHSWKKSPIKELYSKFQKLTKVSNADESHSCSICEINFTNEIELKKHMKTHENLSIIKTNSNVTNLSEGALNVHQCESCNESFTNAGDFIFHIENTHKTADVNFLQS